MKFQKRRCKDKKKKIKQRKYLGFFFISLGYLVFFIPLWLCLLGTHTRENSKMFWFSAHLFVPLQHDKKEKAPTPFKGY